MSKNQLNNMTVKQIKDIIRNHNKKTGNCVKNYSKLRKKDLIKKVIREGITKKKPATKKKRAKKKRVKKKAKTPEQRVKELQTKLRNETRKIIRINRKNIEEIARKRGGAINKDVNDGGLTSFFISQELTPNKIATTKEINTVLNKRYPARRTQ